MAQGDSASSAHESTIHAAFIRAATPRVRSRRGGERDASQPQTATRGITRRMPRSAVAPRPCASTPPLRHCLSRAGALARPPPASGRRCRREHAATHLASREVHVTTSQVSENPPPPQRAPPTMWAHVWPTRAQLCPRGLNCAACPRGHPRTPRTGAHPPASAPRVRRPSEAPPATLKRALWPLAPLQRTR